jgi:hypothetical protein
LQARPSVEVRLGTLSAAMALRSSSSTSWGPSAAGWTVATVAAVAGGNVETAVWVTPSTFLASVLAAIAFQPANVGLPPTWSLSSRASANPRFVALTPASVRSTVRSRPTSTRNRARCDSSASFAPNAAQRACPSARLRVTLRPARVRARTTPDALRARPPCVRHARHNGTRPRRVPSTSVALQHPRAGGRSSPRAIRRAAGVLRTRDALSTSAVSAGRAWRAARSARASARAAFVRRRRIAIPATTSSWAALDAGDKGAGSSSASVRSASSRRPIRRRRRTSRYRACAAFTRSPCSSSVARAASSAFAGQPRSRERSRPRRRHTSRGPRPLSDRRRAQHFAREPLLERDRRAAPSRCLAARAQARRRARRPGSVRRGDHSPRAHAPRP